MFEISIKTTHETDKLIEQFPDKYKRALLKGVKKAVLFAEGEAKRSFGQSGNLKVRTGYLRNSIKSNVVERYNELVSQLYSDNVYSRIHEYGGTIVAKNKPFLRFQIENKWITLRKVTMPARSYLEPAIKNNLKKLGDIISDVVAEEMNK